MRTNIHIDPDLVRKVRELTGLESQREIVDAALRYYVAALSEGPAERVSSLGDEMKAEEVARVLATSPAERIRKALAMGRRQIELEARAEGISFQEARSRHEARKDKGRRGHE